jgi:peptide/nickel transport system substrate-binding protein
MGDRIDSRTTEGLSALSEYEIFCLRELLSSGMRICRDSDMLSAGKNIVAMIDAQNPHLREPQRINILPGMTKPKQSGGIITIGHGSKPSVINPLLTVNTISVNLMEVIFSNLVKFDNTGKAIPDLAYKWDVSPDGLVYTFSIRDDVYFHDGHPLTAHDIEFTYKTMAESDIPFLTQLSGRIADVETQGDYIFRVKLRHPYSMALRYLWRAIAPKHLLDGADLGSSLNRQPVGTGPFKLLEWRDDDTIILKRNDLYFQEARPVLDSLVLKYYEDRNSAIEAIQIGETDMILDMDMRDTLFLSAGRDFHTYSMYDDGYYALLFNYNNPLFQEPDIRRAFDFIIDRDEIILKSLHRYSKPITGPFCIDSFASNPDVKLRYYSIDTAYKLFYNHGWKLSADKLCKDGQELRLSIAMQDSSGFIEKIGVTLRKQLLKAGITIDLVYTDSDRDVRNSCDLILARLSAPGEPDVCSGYWYSSGYAVDNTRYSNKEVDRLFESGRKTIDFEERKYIYRQIHRIMHQDCAAIFLCTASRFLTSRYVLSAGSSLSSVNYFLFSIKDWEIESRTVTQENKSYMVAEG